MSATAIVCEYNPFHKGHKYQLDKVKEKCPHAKIVSVMSPELVQRGRPAVFDKFVRGECAVRCGADLVVSMPQVFSLLSAEGFAEGGVRLAYAIGADSLAFGVEDDNIEKLTEIARILISDEFEESLHKELYNQPFLSFPTVRQSVLAAFTDDDTASLISTPNNILAVEYIKASLRYCPDMKLIPIKRAGNSHCDVSKEGDFISATAIRSIIEEKLEWQSAVPDETHFTLSSAVMIDTQKYDSFLFSVLSVSDYKEILSATGNKELADTVFASVRECGNYASFRKKLSRRKFAETKIDRALANCLLGIKNDEFMHCMPEYATVLAMNPLGREIIRDSSVTMLSKFGDIKKLDGRQIEKELLADRIWAKCCTVPDGEKYFIDKKPFISEHS